MLTKGAGIGMNYNSVSIIRTKPNYRGVRRWMMLDDDIHEIAKGSYLRQDETQHEIGYFLISQTLREKGVRVDNMPYRLLFPCCKGGFVKSRIRYFTNK